MVFLDQIEELVESVQNCIHVGTVLDDPLH